MDNIEPLSALDWHLVEKRQVELVCFAEFDVYFHLSGNALIQFGDAFSHIESGGEGANSSYSFPLSESRLMKLVGCTIVAAQITEQNCVSIRFSNNDLILLTLNSKYETIEVSLAGKRFVGW